MVSITHAETDEHTGEEIMIPAGGRIMDLDWDAVGSALESAGEECGWDADFVIRPDHRHVWVVVDPAAVDHVARTTLDFYAAVSRRIGHEEFMSLWVDFDVGDNDVRSH
ncbi:MAG TPA: hypothetical protein VF092_07685 [Longimicrobium sp.]